ncbi:Isochorismatase hydrolase [Gonapodya prolifera JEL478]|uniref:nicotinamidase n=1 Tax=Gonapodya prolifera (strain JEL478) TaxID=1344416 RepID=A0A139A830_GONPJ|nr:Isochorismatase hydrolase [Gonapodya prolifera JEL478]|eukprot:KXS12940.1 Isochorismatase hydrolase [Gonapodya prolifera JEL478]
MLVDAHVHSYQPPRSFFDYDGNTRTALILVDLQNDFVAGSLAVGEAEKALEVAQKLVASGKFDYVVASQDAHPPDHVSFAGSHKANPELFADVVYDYNGQKVTQTVYPSHCVQGTWGFEIHTSIDKSRIDDFIWKGRDSDLDSYSAFADNLYQKITPLSQLLHKHAVQRVVIVGLATDYCVRATTLDAVKFGFSVLVVPEGCRGVVPSRDSDIYKEMREKGVEVAGLDDARVKAFLSAS